MTLELLGARHSITCGAGPRSGRTGKGKPACRRARMTPGALQFPELGENQAQPSLHLRIRMRMIPPPGW